MSLHEDAATIRSRLVQEGIATLYHFTSVENLPGIAHHQGILSKAELERFGNWPPPSPGGNEDSHRRDRRLGNWDKVHLFFNPNTPMVYRAKSEDHLCFLEVPIDMACLRGVVFTHANAASEMARRGEGLEGLGLVDFRYVKSYPDPSNPDWRHLSQAEVLVPNRIPMDVVKRIVCVSEASKQEAIRLWGSHTLPRFEVDIKPFESMPGSRYAGFSYVTDAWLEAGEQRGQRIAVSNSRHSKIKVVAKLEALAGATCNIQMGPSGRRYDTTLPRTDSWSWTPEYSITDLSPGSYHVDVKLNDIRWSRLFLEVRP